MISDFQFLFFDYIMKAEIYKSFMIVSWVYDLL